jgi:hypothetical protein
MATVFTSKQDIYNSGYPIALKFLPSFQVNQPENCPKYFGALIKTVGGTAAPLPGRIENIDPLDGPSKAQSLKIPAPGAGQGQDLDLILLSHETGLEIFVPMALYGLVFGAGAYVGMKIVDKVIDKALDAAWDRLIKFIGANWPTIMAPVGSEDDPRPDYEIEEVEVRTLTQGIMFIDYAEFSKEQVYCTLKRLHSVTHISKLNKKCFNGKLRPKSKVHKAWKKGSAYFGSKH